MPTKSKRKPAARKPRPKLTDAKLNAMKLHELMKIAMRDTRKQERAKNSVVDMGEWLFPGNGEPCAACFAGSVMRHSQGRLAHRFADDHPAWAMALDNLRLGFVNSALEDFGRPLEPKWSCQYRVPYYPEDRDAWWAAMRKLYRDLKDADL